MHVRCPSCQTVFRLPPGALEVADGLVRCGRCEATFDGSLELEPGEDEDFPQIVVLNDAVDEPATSPVMMLDPDAVLEGVHDDPAPSSDDDDDEEDARAAPARAPSSNREAAQVFGLEQPSQRQGRPARGPVPTLLLAFANVVLLGLLALQLGLGLREPLLASPELRPWLERGCAILGCRLSALRDPERVEIIARDVRAHPRYANGLLVDVTLVNRAPYVQPFPVMQLTFTSLDEQWFAQRRFQPAEYLGPNRGTAERLPPDIPVQVVLELLDPGPDAVSYQFDFL
jgi:predicted Zn finger-like uncharacterized protein